MNGVGRTPILSAEQVEHERQTRQKAEDQKRDSRRSLMVVVAKATDVDVKRAPVATKGQLPHTHWDYHERISTSRRKLDQ